LKLSPPSLNYGLLMNQKQTSYGAFLVLTASFSLNIGITFSARSDFTVSESCFLKSWSLKSLSVTRSWADVTSSYKTNR